MFGTAQMTRIGAGEHGSAGMEASSWREKSGPGWSRVQRLLRAGLGCSEACRARGLLVPRARRRHAIQDIPPSPRISRVNAVDAGPIEIERRDPVKADAVWTAMPFGNVFAGDPARVPNERADTPPSLLAWPPAEFSLSHGVESNVMPCIERMLSARTKLRRGQALYQSGGRFHALYALRTGTCKSVIFTRDGHDQIMGYHIVGEIVGADGIATDAHECEATALEDMDVCPLPFDQIDDIARISDQFRRNLVRLLSRETARTRSMMIMLGTMCADQRLAVFLLDLSQRYGARGYSTHEFVLRMTRSEIGSYLGLKLETVSRLFSRFQQSDLIQVRGRAVTLLDRVALNEIVESGALDARNPDLDSGFRPLAAAIRV